MFTRSVFRRILYIYKCKERKTSGFNSVKNRTLHLSCASCNDKSSKTDLVLWRNFESIDDKSKKSYIEMVHIFENSSIHRRGHVEFIYSALKNMESFGVHKDLEVYKALIDVLPKGKFIPTNLFQAEFMHYPKQQQCIIDVLEQMEDNGVMPDFEMEDMLMNIFGRKGYPLRKFWRMMYWMPKFKNLSPWPLPSPLPDDLLELAKLAVHRISSIDIQAKSTVYQTVDIKESLDHTWIVSSQSEMQKNLLAEHDPEKAVYVEGAFKVWVRDKAVNYFILRAEPKPRMEEENVDLDDVSKLEIPLFGFTVPEKKELMVMPSVHEQEDGVIFALCATGSSSRDSLLSWIRHLEKDGNPALASLSIVFTLRSPEKEVATVEQQSSDKEQIDKR